MRDSNVKALSMIHAAAYKVTGGRIGRRLVNNDMLLLTTTGSHSGTKHTVPLLYLTDGPDLIVIASYGGRPNHPQWYRNLVAEPTASVQIGNGNHTVHAVTMTHEERLVWWGPIVDAYGDYAIYQSRTSREIPVVRLTPDPPTLHVEETPEHTG